MAGTYTQFTKDILLLHGTLNEEETKFTFPAEDGIDAPAETFSCRFTKDGLISLLCRNLLTALVTRGALNSFPERGSNADSATPSSGTRLSLAKVLGRVKKEDFFQKLPFSEIEAVIAVAEKVKAEKQEEHDKAERIKAAQATLDELKAATDTLTRLNLPLAEEVQTALQSAEAALAEAKGE
jgi:hypothetical protein